MATRIQALTAAGALATTDIFYVCQNPSTTPLDRKVTLLSVASYAMTLGIRDTDNSHSMGFACGSNLSANRLITFTPGDAARTITLSGDPTLADWFNQSVKTTASPSFVAVNALTLASQTTGFTIAGGTSSKTLTVAGNSTVNDWFDQSVKAAASPTFAAVNALTLTAQAAGFTVAGGSSSKTLTVAGNSTVNDWFDQSVKSTASPTFVEVTISGTGVTLNPAGSYIKHASGGSLAMTAVEYGGNGNVVIDPANTFNVYVCNSNAGNVYLANGGGNVSVGAAAYPTNGTKCLTMTTGTAPTGTPADTYTLYSADAAAGNACPHFWTELGEVVKLYKSATLTQTYSTADATLSAWTPDDESAAYTTTGADADIASKTDLNALRVAYENLRVAYTDLVAFVNSLVDALQLNGLIG